MNSYRVSAIVACVLVLLAAPATLASAATLPAKWDPGEVAVSPGGDRPFLLRPGQILAASADAADVARVLSGSGWKPAETRAPGVTLFHKPGTAAREVLDALATVRKETAGRRQGPARVAPNHVLVGESAINFMGEPRIQGGPGSSVRFAYKPKTLPLRNALPGDGRGAKIAVLDTGLFKHEWLTDVHAAPGADDVWDAEGDGYGDNESGHGTFIAGLIKQVAPAAEVYAVKVLDSHGVGDDLTVATELAKLPADVDIVNLSLGGYTENDQPPLAIANVLPSKTRIVVAAAGNHADKRPFWPAAFGPALSVGAVEDGETGFTAAPYSNFGAWVDLVARGSNLESAFAYETTLVAQGAFADPFTDPAVTFEGWAEWDGTSFATPIAAAMVARTMSRAGIGSAADAAHKLAVNSPSATLADFPNAKLIDELR
mgnify:CR=1 FL=1